MFYHFLALEGGHPTWEENFNAKYQNARSFILSHTNKPDQQKKRDVVPKSAANIYPPYKYEFFLVILLLTYHEALFNSNIVLSFHPPFEPISAQLTITGLWPAVQVQTLVLVVRTPRVSYSSVAAA